MLGRANKTIAGPARHKTTIEWKKLRFLSRNVEPGVATARQAALQFSGAGTGPSPTLSTSKVDIYLFCEIMASALIIKSPEKSIMKSNVGFVKMMTEEDATHDSGGILRGLLSRAGECDRHTRNKYLWKQAVTSI